MEELIQEKLHEIEKRENCRILLAVESGSRAWGFASPDSDYDVRFIYVRDKESYLKLNRPRDVIELPINDVLDINGWDVEKALKLLHKSNPTVFFLSRYLQDHPIRRPVQACHAALLLFQKWPVALPSDGKWKLPRLPKEGHGQSKEIFLCSAADPGLPLDSGQGDTSSNAI